MKSAIAASPTRWELLGSPEPETLAAPRRELHRALELLTAFAEAYVPASADGSHTGLEWHPAQHALYGRPTATRVPLRLGLAVRRPALLLATEEEAGASRFELAGRTQADAETWLLGELATAWAGDTLRPLARPDFALPPGPGSEAQPFTGRPEAAFGELSRWYGNGDLVLHEIARREGAEHPVVCWPHHFDLAVLLPAPRTSRPEEGSIGVGLSPGDDTYDQPYWYVTPFPHPEHPHLPALPAGGGWHREGWLGAVLVAERLVGSRSEKTQRTQAETFLRAAVAACRDLAAATE